MKSELSFPFPDIPAPGSVIEVRPGVLWARMPLPMRLNHINVYLLRDEAGWWIVDTGMRGNDTRACWEQIFAGHLDGLPIVGILCTHAHPDHVGQAGWLNERWKAPLWMTHGEYYSARTWSSSTEDGPMWEMLDFLGRAGMSEGFLESFQRRSGGFAKMVEPLPRSYRRLMAGDALRIGGHVWEAVIGYGHSVEHLCLLDRGRELLLSGDQVIPLISSNVSVMGVEPEANPLRYWLESLQRFLSLPGEVLVLPAHNTPFFGLHARLRALIAHHEEHLQALEQACVTPRNAYELLPVIFHRELDEQHALMAVGECIAHLNLLRHRGAVVRELDDRGRFRYRSVDAMLPDRARSRDQRDDDDPLMEFEGEAV